MIERSQFHGTTCGVGLLLWRLFGVYARERPLASNAIVVNRLIVCGYLTISRAVLFPRFVFVRIQETLDWNLAQYMQEC